ncbi:ABC transporter ATP-binding protein [Sporolactobacillus sp. Y61]|jgi:oligopeptide transport system ATP-binding protein|uniref:ABC transporter ATP-binding protein n=1 Tax=Sporolactobacillus sp. Y61 TaxID=3160863 RepID=A0AAU8IC29_9BACL|nr:ABC transporter ATP-binding protein [Sporolactobacillus sp. THM19-2]RYL91468.1 ABC transporter ATP-binding protein [Sporolactobacillus sp. THM19-2]
MDHLLELKNLTVHFNLFNATVQAVRDVSFHLDKGETLAIVGESGSGKSVTSKAIMGLIPNPPGEITSGEIIYNGHDLAKYSKKQMQRVRGKEISMIFQDPMTALNPTMKVGKQIMESLIKHQNMSRQEARTRTVELLKLVGIPKPESRVDNYPHQFSGGMRQRVVIAIALACNPQILIADEPTTALDVTIQAQILDLMRDLQQKTGTAIILITHDLGVVANLAQRVAVMYGGKIVETGTLDEIFYKPKHPYTWGLLSSMPKLHAKTDKLTAIPGSPPDLSDPPKGCPFAPRCPYAMKVCTDHMPDYTELSATQKTACWLLDDRAPKVDPPQSIGVGGKA